MPTIANSLVKSTVLAALVATTGTAEAYEAAGRQIIKPLQALKVSAGTTDGIGYFVSEAGHCKLVITLAERSPFGVEDDFAATRFETALVPGSSKTFNRDATSLHFRCEQGATAMSVESKGQVAEK